MNQQQPRNLQEKRTTGEFFTSGSLAKYTGSKLLSFITPDILIEPYAGDGVLLDSFITKDIQCIVNDMNPNNIALLKKNFPQNNVTIFNENFINIEQDTITSNWLQSTENKVVLIYTNPPFGTVSTNKLARKTFEQTVTQSRNLTISYAGLERYGRGDLLLPAVGKLIEIMKTHKDGYLAFYSPLGLFCKRKRYIKLLQALLQDFQFIWGEIFSGDQFANVSKQKPIALTLWKFKEGIQTTITALLFQYREKVISLKPMPLLKDYWKYDTRKRIHGEIAVQGNDRFNVVAPKMFHVKVEKGGSELVPENISKPLNLEFIPDELAIGLWSVTIGYRSLTTYPIYMDNAYVHLPDFFSSTVQKILAFAALHVLITEELNHYTNGKIGFDVSRNKIHFGNKNLTEGIITLLNNFKDVSVGNYTISDVVNELKSLEKIQEHHKEWRKALKDGLESFLREIGYWDCIPLPLQ